jgi:hypothetical protein
MKKGLLIGLMVAGLAYVGICTFAMVRDVKSGQNLTGLPTMPDVAKAPYYVYIENTGRLLLTSRYDRQGDVYILHGFWELDGETWKYRKGDIPLDEKVFGKITVRRRE